MLSNTIPLKHADTAQKDLINMGNDIHILRNLVLEYTEDICIYTVGHSEEWGQREKWDEGKERRKKMQDERDISNSL